MGWRGQHNRELDAEAEQRAWWTGLTPGERWRIRADRYGPLVAGAVIVGVIWRWLA